MSLPRYPEYKNSGAQWIGKVPAHWPVLKIKTFTEFSGGGTPSRDKLAYWNGDIPWVSPKDMKSERITGAEECITSEGLLNSSSSMVDAGRLLMVVRSGILKHTIPVAINDVPVALNQDMKALRFSEQLATSGFFLRWVQGLNDALLLAWAKQGATVESIEHSYLAETPVPLPPLDEQHAIATFLDRETSKIDALIAEQEKLLALLAEKRQATISHAVTRGLNPNAPVKDSGIAWLGEVPAHWAVKPLRYCIDFQEGPGIMAADFRDEGVPLLRVAGVQSHWASLDGCNYLDLEKVAERWEHFRVREGDLLISASASMGTVCEVGKDVVGCIPYTGIIRLRGIDGVMAKDFIRYLVVSSQFMTQIDQLKAGATIQHYGPTHLSQMIVAVPPIVEQQGIAALVNGEVRKFDALQADVQSAIGLLNERRSALISAAVTGKIDLRGEVAGVAR